MKRKYIKIEGMNPYVISIFDRNPVTLREIHSELDFIYSAYEYFLTASDPLILFQNGKIIISVGLSIWAECQPQWEYTTSIHNNEG